MQLEAAEREILFPSFAAEDAAHVLSGIGDEDAADLASRLTPSALAVLLDEMEPDEAADLLGDLDLASSRAALAQMRDAQEVQSLLRYPDDSAGGLMTSDYYAFSQQTRVGQVFRTIRHESQREEEIPYIFALDEQGRLTGVVRLADLIRAHPDQSLDAVASTEFLSVSAKDDQEIVVRLINRHDLLAVPVLDDARRLLGVITADDVMATQEEEDTEDIYQGAGIVSYAGHEAARSDLLVSGSLWRIWLVRVPFLIVTLIGGLLAGGIIGIYEDALESIVILAFFIPVVMGMGGNSGVQSTTIFIRGHALGQIDLRQFGKHLLREAGVGLGMGVTVGLLAGVVAAVWQGMAEIGLVVGLALACTLTLATALGFAVPYVLIKLGLDPAAGSDPLITTIKDITGLLIYFSFAYWFLGHLF